MGQSKEQRAAIEERRRRVAGLHLRRVPKGQIAKAMDVDPDTITADIKWLEEQWSKELIDDPVSIRAEELASLREMERVAAEYLNGYNAMKNGDVVRIAGDGRWFSGWLATKERIAKLLGLDAPTKKEITGKSGKPLEVTLWDMVREAASDDPNKE